MSGSPLVPEGDALAYAEWVATEATARAAAAEARATWAENLVDQLVPGIDLDSLSQFGRRLIQDAVEQQSIVQMRRRAEELDAVGTAWARSTARALRLKVRVLEMPSFDLDAEVAATITGFWQAIDPTGEGRARIDAHHRPLDQTQEEAAA